MTQTLLLVTTEKSLSEQKLLVDLSVSSHGLITELCLLLTFTSSGCD